MELVMPKSRKILRNCITINAKLITPYSWGGRIRESIHNCNSATTAPRAVEAKFHRTAFIVLFFNSTAGRHLKFLVMLAYCTAKSVFIQQPHLRSLHAARRQV